MLKYVRRPRFWKAGELLVTVSLRVDSLLVCFHLLSSLSLKKQTYTSIQTVSFELLEINIWQKLLMKCIFNYMNVDQEYV